MQEFISSILKHYKNESFTSVFNAFRPFLFDLLKRRESFNGFIQSLRKISKEVNPKCHAVIKTFEVRDLIALLIESCSPKSMAKLGSWLVNQFYPLPIVSKIAQNRFKANLNCCSEVMFQTQRSLITSIGTKNSIKTGKSSILSYLFSIKTPGLFSTQEGLTHMGSIDLYTKFPQEGFEHIVADINGFVDDKIFQTISSTVLTFSQLALIHITQKDVTEKDEDIILSSDVNAIIVKAKKFVLLFRDYDENKHQDLITNIEKSLINKFPNYIKTIPVPNFAGSENLNTLAQKYEVMQSVLEALKKLENSAISPLIELKNAYELENPQGSNNGYTKIDIAKESSLTTKLLKEKFNEIKEKSLYQTFFPCIWLDIRLSEELKEKAKIEKERGDLSINQIESLRKRYEENEQKIKEYQDKKKEVVASDLIRHIISIVSSNDLLRILLLSETINNWKMPLYEPTKRKYLELYTQKQTTNNDNKEINEKMKKLELEMDDRDVTLDTFLDEIASLYETNKMGTDVKGLQDYIRSTLQQGAPVNLVNGKTLKFGSQVLEDLFEKYEKENTKVYVISIIGAQSSAKSTLLNVLFGCGFATSAGRCTKGLYVTLLQHPNGNHFVIIETEGLLSIVARDHEFDNLITTMAFSCSHIVLINIKGEINSKLRDLLEICVFAMKHLKLTHIKPKIMFALRDIANDSLDVQREMLIHMKSSLQQAAKMLLIDIDKFIEISEEDVFLLPSAFQLSQAENGSRIQTNNNLFSLKVLDMRNYIFKYLATMDHKLSLVDLRSFYERSEQLWNDINGYGKEIMKARNFLEIELKDDGFEKINEIFKKYDKIFLDKGRALLDYHKSQFRYKIGISPADFVQLLTKEFNKVRDMAFEDLDREVINNEKYVAVSSYHREFRETLEYYLRWQCQNLICEWRSSVIVYECFKEVDDFKADIKSQIDQILQSKQGVPPKNIIELFDKIKSKSNLDFIQKMEELKKYNIDKLVPEIQGHYEYARQKIHRKEKKYITIPTVGELIKRINQDRNPIYEQHKWLKIGKLSEWTWNNHIHYEKLEVIKKEFNSLKNELKNIVANISTEDVALNVMEACIAKLTKMETNKLPVSYTPFMHSCLLEAMFTQYTKTKDSEIAKITKVQAEHEAALRDEEKHIKELLDLSKDNWGKGEATAKRCYRDIQKAFYLAQELALQDAVMKKIREQFPTPESANQKAYKDSFEISNYSNVVKYVLNINKFIKEIYNEKIKVIADFEIDRRLEIMRNEFISVIQELMVMADCWSKDNEMNERVDLSTLYIYAKKNPKVSNYFPDLYIVQLSDVVSFNRGFKKGMSDLLANFDLKKEIKENIKNKVEEYLNNQYNSLVGCQARCPICNNKCIKPDTQHKDHHTNCHLLAAFSGKKGVETNEAILVRCFDPKNYNCKWERGDKKYRTFDDFINAEYSEWRAEFPTAKEPEKHEANIPAAMMEC